MADEKKKKKHAGHGFKKVHIEHHGDSSHTVHHEHEDGAASDKKHAVADLDGVHDSLQDHLGTPNVGEQEAEMGQHGVPAAQAGPAGLPMPAAAAPGMGA